MELKNILERIKALKCPQCGSTDIDLISFQSGKCKHCGTTVLIEEPKKEVVNNININVNPNNGIVQPFYEIQKEFDFKEFEKQLYQGITYNTTTPTDILDADFSAPYEQRICFVKHTGEVTLSYNCSVGYDHKKEYQEWSSSTKSYITRTKTVTDWKPLSGTFTGKYEEVFPQGENYTENYSVAEEKACASKCIRTAQNRIPVDGSDFDISDDKKRDAEHIIERNAARDCESGISADHIKDFSYSAIVNITETEFYKLPRYSIDYKYNGASYQLNAFAAGKFQEYGLTPNVSENIKSEAEIKNLYFVLPSFLFILASIIVSIFIQNELFLTLTFAVSTIAFITTKIMFKKLRNSIINKRQSEKERKLETFLKRKGLN